MTGVSLPALTRCLVEKEDSIVDRRQGATQDAISLPARRGGRGGGGGGRASHPQGVQAPGAGLRGLNRM